MIISWLNAHQKTGQTFDAGHESAFRIFNVSSFKLILRFLDIFGNSHFKTRAFPTVEMPKVEIYFYGWLYTCMICKFGRYILAEYYLMSSMYAYPNASFHLGATNSFWWPLIAKKAYLSNQRPSEAMHGPSCFREKFSNRKVSKLNLFFSKTPLQLSS